MKEKPMDILERIRSSYYQLTATERKVADYVMAQHDQVQLMSITQLADECGVADATVSRFCRSLKLKGFNAFKIELARYSAGGTAAHQNPQVDQSLPTRSQECARQAHEAIQQTMDLLEPGLVEKTVRLLEAAPQVMCFGSGGSTIMASTFAQLFSTVTGKFFAVSDSHMQMSAVATMGKQDVIVLFSYSGATTAGIQILELAKSRGIHTILITRFSKSPAAKLASVVLRCGSNEGPFQFSSVPAKVAQLIVMDVIFQEYCSRNREECDKNIQSIAAALSGMHL